MNGKRGAKSREAEDEKKITSIFGFLTSSGLPTTRQSFYADVSKLY
jgi:hypothetical protein